MNESAAITPNLAEPLSTGSESLQEMLHKTFEGASTQRSIHGSLFRQQAATLSFEIELAPKETRFMESATRAIISITHLELTPTKCSFVLNGVVFTTNSESGSVNLDSLQPQDQQGSAITFTAAEMSRGMRGFCMRKVMLYLHSLQYYERY